MGGESPVSEEPPPQSDSSLGLGSSPKAARRAYVCFSTLCHFYSHSAHGQHHPGRPASNSVILLSRTPTCPQETGDRAFPPSGGHTLSSISSWSLASSSCTSGIVRNGAGRHRAREEAEPGLEPCSLRLHHRRHRVQFSQDWISLPLRFSLSQQHLNCLAVS